MTPATTALSSTRRGPFDGMLQIVRFNWTRYVQALLTITVAVAAIKLVPMPVGGAGILAAGAALAGFWVLGSLVASHWVYDRSPLCRWRWIAEDVNGKPATLVNIHAGFDESSASLRELFPGARLSLLDIFDPAEMTEPSIARARTRSPVNVPATAVDYRHLPLPSGHADLVTLLLAAHELRHRNQRRAFLMEVERILAPQGQAIFAEHLRDVPNFLALGPGFLHFHSRRTWLSDFLAAGLSLRREFRITPLVRVFILERSAS